MNLPVQNKSNLMNNEAHTLNSYREITRCFIGSLVKRGCKKRAKKIFTGVLEFLRSRIDEHPLVVLDNIFFLTAPKVSLLVKKRGGSSYKLPYRISYKRGISIGIHSLLRAVRVRQEWTLAEKLGNELIEIIKGKSTGLIKQRDDIHNIALSNRPFLRYLKRRIKHR